MLPSQVSYWNLVEAGRHNREMEKIERSSQAIRSREADIKQQEATTNVYRARTDRQNSEINSINALTAQTEAFTRQRAQDIAEGNLLFNYDKLAQEREFRAQEVAVAQQNAASTQIQANASATQSYAYANKADVEAKFIPLTMGAGAVGSVVDLLPKVTNLVKKGAKSVSNLFSNARYNLMN